MVVSGSPKGWDRWHSPSPNSHLYTTYIPCLLGGYMLGNQKQPLVNQANQLRFVVSSAIYDGFLEKNIGGSIAGFLLAIIRHFR